MLPEHDVVGEGRGVCGCLSEGWGETWDLREIGTQGSTLGRVAAEKQGVTVCLSCVPGQVPSALEGSLTAPPRVDVSV